MQVKPYMENVFTENKAFEHTSSGDMVGVAKWDWSSLGLSAIARQSGIFDTTQPIIKYSYDEVGYPFKNGQTIWDMCTNLVSQVMFTMPMVVKDEHWTPSVVARLLADGHEFDPIILKDWDVDENIGETSGLSELEKYVNGVLKDAFTHSSTFWHYAMRHAPSHSLACESEDAQTLNSSVKFDLSHDASIPVDLYSSASIPVHGYAAHSLGGAGTACLCGWHATRNATHTTCHMPAVLCSVMKLQTCDYILNSEYGDEVEKSILDTWNGDASVDSHMYDAPMCPETDVSDAWGVIMGMHMFSAPDGSESSWFAASTNKTYKVSLAMKP